MFEHYLNFYFIFDSIKTKTPPYFTYCNYQQYICFDVTYTHTQNKEYAKTSYEQYSIAFVNNYC